jgi:hypothetical protein
MGHIDFTLGTGKGGDGFLKYLFDTIGKYAQTQNMNNYELR